MLLLCRCSSYCCSDRESEVVSENEDEGGDLDALALLADEAAGAADSPPLSSLQATRMPYGVPGVITAFRRGAIVSLDAERLARAVRLHMRANRTVGEDCVAIMSKIHQECADNGHFCKLVATTDAAGRYTSLRLSWATREMQENALRHKLTDVVGWQCRKRQCRSWLWGCKFL